MELLEKEAMALEDNEDFTFENQRKNQYEEGAVQVRGLTL